MEAFDGRVFDGPLHPLDMAIGPRVVGLCQAALYPIGFVNHVEAHRSRVDGVTVPALLCELNAIISQVRVAVLNGFTALGTPVTEVAG